MKKTSFSLLLLLSCSIAFNQTFRKLNVNNGLSSGFISETHSPFDIGVIHNVFDNNTGTLVRCQPAYNPMVITLEFDTASSIGGCRVLSAQPAIWTIEGAMTMNDLNSQTGTYSLLTSGEVFADNVFDSGGFEATKLKFIRLSLERTTSDYYPHLREWEIYYELNPALGDYALQFDGINDQVNTGLMIDQSFGTKSYTFEAWVYPTSVSSGRHMVISTDNGSYDWSILREGSTWYVFNGSTSVNTGFSVDLNQWQHIAAVFIPGTGIRFYKNGAEAILNGISLESSYNPISIAENPGTPYNEYFTGIIDEVRIWESARTQYEIKSFMTTKVVEHEPGLLASWHFDEGKGTTTYDSKNTNDGTLVNGPVWVTNVAPLTIVGHDLSLVEISSPKSGCYEESDQPISVAVRNSGSNEETAFDISYVFGSDTITESVSGILLEPNDIYHHTFSLPIDIPSVGTYNLKAYIHLSDYEIPQNDTATIQFEYSNPFEYELSNDDSICSGQHTTLSATGGSSYRWSTGNTNSSITVNPASSTNYTITIFGEGEGCFYEDSVYVHVLPVPAKPEITADNTTACTGDTILLTSSITTNLRWSTGKYTPSIGVTRSGIYTVTHTGVNGCSVDSDPFTTSFVPKPYISSVMKTICRDDTLVLYAQNSTSCAWSTGENSLSIGVSPQTTTTYYLNGYNTIGCNVIDSIEVNVMEPIPVQRVTNMLPVDSSLLLDPPVHFSWLPGENTVLYDMYIWLDGSPRPTSPIYSNLDDINLRYNGYLIPDTLYNWQIISKNSCSSAESDTNKFSIVSPPDLLIDSVNVPKTAHTGAKFSLSWFTRNIGGPTKKSWCDAIYLSEDKNFDVTDIYIGLKSNGIYLDTNESYKQTAEFRLPNNVMQGNYYVLVKVNHTSCKYIYESNRENNITASDSILEILLTPPPDLQVMPQIAVPADAFSSQEISITYHVKNYGTGPTREKVWRDYVFLSSSADRSLSDGILLDRISHSGILKNDSSYTCKLTALLPQGISGNYYVHIITDYEDVVYEFAYEENNWRVSDSISVMLLPPPDLTVEEVLLPLVLNIGETYDINCIIENSGFESTTEDIWQDSIYYYLNGDLNNLYPLGGKKHKGKLEQAGKYSISFSTSIPSIPDESPMLLVKTDAGNQVFEHNCEDNNSYYSDLNILYPDLSTVIVNLPDTMMSGESSWISYFVKNTGYGYLKNQNRTDGIFLTKTNNTSSGFVLKENSGKEIIYSKDSLLLTVPMNIPDSVYGTHYFYVKADLENTIVEKPEENNNTSNLSKSVYIKLSPTVDLSVIGILCKDTISAGDELNISWMVRNSGEGIAKPDWTDHIYLSETPDLNTENAVLLKEVIVKDTIHSGDYIQTNYIYKSNPTLSGAYYIIINCDAKNQVYEDNNEDNNLLNKKIVINPYPSIDLSLDTIICPSNGWSGEKVNISYTVKNNGDGKTLRSSWYDMLYLSEDKILSNDDVELTPKNKHSGPLSPGEEYTKPLNVTLPNGISGTYFLIAETDWKYEVYDSDRPNNMQTSEPISISLSPSPDIVVDTIIVKEEYTAGQPDTMKYKISNIGQTDIGNIIWYDYIYLSVDPYLNSFDKPIGRIQHTDSLKVGNSEFITCPIEIPVTASGNYYILISADDKNSVYEHNAEENNNLSCVTSIYLPPPSDLIVKNIFSDDSVLVGDSSWFYWNTFNQGDNIAIGRTQENIYLSMDETWDVNDALVTEIDKKINIAPDDFQPDSVRVHVPGVKPGNYHVVVRTDITNRIPEDIETNNAGYSLARTYVDMQKINPGSTKTTTMSNNRNYYYKIVIHDSLSGEILSVRLNNSSPDIQGYLFASYDKIPDNSSFDYASNDPFSGNQEIIVPNVIPGTYFIQVSYQGNVPEQTANISATILPFRIEDIYTSTGGNSGQVTVKISGSKFKPSTTFGLKAASHTIESVNNQNIDLLSSYATFDLKGQSKGLYDVFAVNPDGDTTWLRNGFEVSDGQNTGLSINLQHPASTRGTQIIRISLDFANLSNVDIPTPVVRLTSTGGSPVSLNLDDLRNGSSNTELVLSLKEPGGPENILRAKQGGSITIYCSSSPAPSFMITQIK